ncbi:MAG: DUF4331 family protein, partial [Acidimicrobiia bacterium]|nr:DUF4331 family protein [Acidimicrobiia bacterium]
MTKGSWTKLALVTGLVVALAAPIAGAGAADHLDAPAAGDFQTDINDLYVFEGQDPSNTVLAVTAGPAAGAGLFAGENFADKDLAGYQIRIDTDGDAVEDITYQFDFITKDDGTQQAQVRRVDGRKATALEPRGRVIANVPVGETAELKDGGQVFTGLRSDPFFFDVIGFFNTIEGVPF